MILGLRDPLSSYFSDAVCVKNYSPYKISKITLFYTVDFILGIKANYYSLESQTTVKGKPHKVSKKLFGIHKAKLKLDLNEYVTQVSGNFTEQGIIMIHFKTNCQKELNIGGTLGIKFEWVAPEGFHLGYIEGGINNQLNFLELNAIPFDSRERKLDNIFYNWDVYQQFLFEQGHTLVQKKEEEFKQQIDLEDNHHLKNEIDHLFTTPMDQRFVVQVCNPKVLKDQQSNKITQKLDKLLKYSKYVEYEIIIWRIHDCTRVENKLVIPLQKKPFFQQYRRFKEFLLLREVMVNKWPGIFIPPLPVEPLLNDYSTTTIERIRLQLELFLTRVANIPFLIQSIEFQLFLKGIQNEPNMNIIKQLKNLRTPSTYEQVKLRYEQTFSLFKSQSPANEQNKAKIIAFKEFLRKNQIIVENHIKSIQQIKTRHEKSNQGYYLFSKNLLGHHWETLALYHPEVQQKETERRALLEKSQLDTTINFDQNNQQMNPIDLNIKPTTNTVVLNNLTYDDLLQQLQIEFYDMDAFNRTIKYLETLEIERGSLQHRISGKSFNLKPPTDIQIQQYRKDWDSIGMIQQLIQNIYCSYYVDRFYKEKYEFFYFVLKRLTEAEIHNLQEKKNFWSKLNEELGNL